MHACIHSFIHSFTYSLTRSLAPSMHQSTNQLTNQVVRPGGRVVVLSYHSLEDRRVKRVLRSGSLHGRVSQDLKGNVLSPWRPLRKVPKAPGPAEVSASVRQAGRASRY